MTYLPDLTDPDPFADLPLDSPEDAAEGWAGTGAAPNSDQVRALVARSLEEDQAQDVVTIDLSGKSTLADAMVIASGRSARNVAAIAEKLAMRLREAGVRSVRLEGLPAADWVVLDAGDVIVHVFRPEVRGFYNLEKMWSLDLPLRPGPSASTRLSA